MRFSASSGIAIGPILFIVAILAILATAIAAGSSTFSSGTDQEKARVTASTILDYGTQMRAAIARLTASGCSESQISLENLIYPGYSNGNAPADKHCHVFDVAGAGLLPLADTSAYYTRFVFGGKVQGIGSGKASLVMIVNEGSFRNVDFAKICLAFNTLVSIPNIGTTDTWTSIPADSFAPSGAGAFYQQAYNDSTPGTIGTVYASFAGKMAGCSASNGSGSVFFVLLVR